MALSPSNPSPRSAAPQVNLPPSGAGPRPTPSHRLERQPSAVVSGQTKEPRVLPAVLGRWATRIGAALLVVAAGVALVGGPSGGEEAAYPNYSAHVQPVTQHVNAAGRNAVRKVGSTGRSVFQQAVEVGNPLKEKTQSIRSLINQSGSGLAGTDVSAADTAFKKLQQIPSSNDPTLNVKQPSLTGGMAASLANGSSDLYQLYVYDSCMEDGDIVDLIINGQHFATVPITHAGATLTIPVQKGQTQTVVLRGVRDGGGGITVAFRSSEGDFFARSMAVGQSQQVALVAR